MTSGAGLNERVLEWKRAHSAAEGMHVATGAGIQISPLPYLLFANLSSR